MRCNSRDYRSAVVGGILGKPDRSRLVLARLGGRGVVSCHSRDHRTAHYGVGAAKATAIGAAAAVTVGRVDVTSDGATGD